MTSKRDSAWYSLGSGAFAVETAGMMLIVNALLGLSDTGAFSLSMSVSQLLFILGIFGVNNFHMSDYAREHSLSQYVAAKLWSSALLLLGLFAAFVILPNEKALLTVLLTFNILIHSLADTPQNEAFRNGHVAFVGKSNLIRVLSSLLCFAVLVATTRSLILALLVKCFVNLIFLIIYTAKPYYSVIGVPRNGRSILIACLPLAVSTFLMNYILNSPKYQIEAILDDTAQGVFGILFLMAHLVNLFSQFIYRLSFPRFSKYLSAGDKKSFVTLLMKMLVLIVVLTAFLLCGIQLFGIYLLSWFFQIDISQWRVVISYILAGSACSSFSVLLYYLLIIMRRQSLILACYGISAITAFASAYFFVTRYALTGAAISFVVVHVGLCIMLALALSSSLRKV